jgi:hypothetical protein
MGPVLSPALQELMLMLPQAALVQTWMLSGGAWRRCIAAAGSLLLS